VLPTVFGFSFSELVVVVIVALVVMGPKDLPKMLRRVGQWAGKIRRAAADLRAQSGIDDALRSEGLADDIAEIRKLARGELDAVQRMARVDEDAITRAMGSPTDNYGRGDDFHVVRDREYPRDGADAYAALPDNAIVYAETLPRSQWARDPLYLLGDADAELPPEPEPPAERDELDGAAGPTLVGGVGLPVPYEPPSDEAPPDAPRSAGAADIEPRTLMGIAPSEVDGKDDEGDGKKDDETPETKADEAATSAEARS